MPPDLAPNAMLAVLWAALANSVPAAFWSVAFLLLPAHGRHLDGLLRALPPPDDADGLVRVREASLLLLQHVARKGEGEALEGGGAYHKHSRKVSGMQLAARHGAPACYWQLVGLRTLVSAACH